MLEKIVKISLKYYKYTWKHGRENCSCVSAVGGTYAVKVKQRVKI
jgi:hypothetical protein